jgi:hypothetical protein
LLRLLWFKRGAAWLNPDNIRDLAGVAVTLVGKLTAMAHEAREGASQARIWALCADLNMSPDDLKPGGQEFQRVLARVVHEEHTKYG